MRYRRENIWIICFPSFSLFFQTSSLGERGRDKKRQEETDKRRQEKTRGDRQEEARKGKRMQEETFKAGIQHEKKEE